MKAGTPLLPFVVDPISSDAMRLWSGFLADSNPIHLDPEAVKAKGLGDRTINQGPANLAYLINLISLNFPDMMLTSLQSRYNGNVFAGDRCVANGQVSQASKAEITCELWLEVKDQRVVTATATLRYQQPGLS